MPRWSTRRRGVNGSPHAKGRRTELISVRQSSMVLRTRPVGINAFAPVGGRVGHQAAVICSQMGVATADSGLLGDIETTRPVQAAACCRRRAARWLRVARSRGACAGALAAGGADEWSHRRPRPSGRSHGTRRMPIAGGATLDYFGQGPPAQGPRAIRRQGAGKSTPEKKNKKIKKKKKKKKQSIK